MKRRKIPYSRAELAFIKKHKTMVRWRLHVMFVEMFDRPDVSYENIKDVCRRYGWRTGRPRYQFTAASPQWGWRPVGSERVWDGYVQRKIKDVGPSKQRWRWLHLINFEAVNGPLPAGHVLKCLDGNTQNTEASNWVAVPKGVLSRLNGGPRQKRLCFDRAPPELKPTLMAIAVLEHKLHQKDSRQ